MASTNRKFKWITIFIVILWATMMLFLLQREYFPYLTSTQTNYEEILKDTSIKTNKITRKARSMEVFYGSGVNTSIGRINSIITSLPDGTHELSTRAELNVPKEQQERIKKISQFVGLSAIKTKDEGLTLTMETTAIVGPDYQLQKLDFLVRSNFLDASFEGKMKTGKLLVSMKKGDQIINKEIQLPRNTVAMNQFDAMPVPKNLKVGQKFYMRWFDPLTQKYRNIKSKVIGKENIIWQRKKVSTHVIHSDSGVFKTATWIDMNGDVLRYDIAGFSFRLRQNKNITEKKKSTPIKNEKKND